MRNFILVILFTFFSSWSFAQGNDGQTNLFKCVDNESLALDNNCLSTAIEKNDHFIEFQDRFNSDIADLGGNVMSTVIFYPELMQIRIIAHVAEPSKTELAAHQPVQGAGDTEIN